MKNLLTVFTVIVVSAIIFMASREPHESPYTEYRVIERCGYDKAMLNFQSTVSTWMKEGWIPIGGIEVIDDNSRCYYQAMAR